MPDLTGELRTRWFKVDAIEDLADGQVIQLRDEAGNNYAKYIVRIEEIRGTAGAKGIGARFKDPNDPDINIHYHAGARSLVAAGLVYSGHQETVHVYDVWATETQVWSYRGGSRWLELAVELIDESDDPPVHEIPDDARLIWRYNNTVER